MNVVVVAKITKCVGVKGCVKVQPVTHSPKRLAQLHDVLVGETEESALPYIVEDVEFRTNAVLVKFVNVDDRTAAESMINGFVFIPEDKLVPPEKGSYFVHDIVGCEVWSTDRQFLGTVEDVYKYPAQDVWAVRNKSKLHMIPAVKEFIRHVDLEHRKILVQVIEGLIEE